MRLCIVAGSFLLASCTTLPEVYAPPVQRQPVLTSEAPKTVKRLLKMSDPETDSYIVQDIPRNDRSAWRWAGPRPTVRIYLTVPAGNRMSVEYSIADATLKDTGPVTLKFLVNDKPLDSVRHDKAGQFTFDKPIPPEMLKPNAENDLAVEVDKVWVAPTDGAKLGFIINSIGFLR